MTKLGAFLRNRSAKQSTISAKTGISKSRLSLLCNNPKTKLSGKELYLISLAIEASPLELFEFLYGELSLIEKASNA